MTFFVGSNTGAVKERAEALLRSGVDNSSVVFDRLVETGYNEGEPLATWATANGFFNVFDDTAAACRAVLQKEEFR